MCGICGAVAGSMISPFEVEKVQKLLILNSFRGMDSSGMFDYIDVKEKTREIIRKRKKETIKVPEWAHWKETLEPYIFATRVIPQVELTRWKPNTLKAVVCHARAATQGKISKENAHPFRYQNIVGVHNGTIFGDFDGRKECDVDSAALIMNIQKLGPKKAIEMITEKATSIAYAVVYMDLDKKTLNVMRNSQRPLHYYTTAGTTFFSSDKKDLAYTFNHPMSHVDLKEFRPEILYTLDLTKGFARFEEEDMDLPRKVYPVTHYPIDNRFGKWDEETSSWIDQPPRHNRRGNSWDDDHKVLPMLGRTSPEDERRDKESYLRTWFNETWKSWLERGLTMKSQAYDFYDIAFDRYFSEYMMKMLQHWKEDPLHKPEYDEIFEKKWNAFNPMMKRITYDKCRIKPKNITMDPLTGNLTRFIQGSALFPDPKEDLTEPFGTTGKRCSQAQYAKKLERGCVSCDRDVAGDEKVFWVDDKDFLCEQCQWSAIGDANHLIHHYCDVRKIESFLDSQTRSLN